MDKPAPIKTTYRQAVWEIYARSIALVTIIVIVAAFIMGGRGLTKLMFPKFTISANLHEKYKSNTAFTDFGTFHKGLSDDEITLRRTANYEKLQRMEKRAAVQNLTYVAFALIGVLVINIVLMVSLKFRRWKPHRPET